ncbi:MAG TPA: hypothetical protein VGM44_11960 [Polyangiaceae bacterium]|jgi:hypothetical protein
MSSGGSAGSSSDTFTSALVSLPAKKTGVMTLDQYTPDKTTFQSYVALGFDIERGLWDGCTRYTLGACFYYDCPPGSNSLDNTDPHPAQVDAGDASFVGMSSGSIFKSSDDIYRTDEGTSQIWPLSGGGRFRFSLSGSASVPAFTMQIKTPPTVWLTSINGLPMHAYDGGVTPPNAVARSAGASALWTSGGKGTVFSRSSRPAAKFPSRFARSTRAPTAAYFPPPCCKSSTRACTSSSFVGISAARCKLVIGTFRLRPSRSVTSTARAINFSSSDGLRAAVREAGSLHAGCDVARV